MKFFVSGKLGLEERAREAMNALRDAGHQITFDWTSIGHLRPYDENILACREAAVRECNGVKEANVLVIIAHNEGVGMYVELGMAIGVGIPVRVVTSEESPSVFLHHPLVKKVNSIREVIAEFS